MKNFHKILSISALATLPLCADSELDSPESSRNRGNTHSWNQNNFIDSTVQPLPLKSQPLRDLPTEDDPLLRTSLENRQLQRDPLNNVDLDEDQMMDPGMDPGEY